MIVELVGLPGSGKTTTSRNITSMDHSIQCVLVGRTSRAELVRQPVMCIRQVIRWGPLLVRWSQKRAGTELVKRRICQEFIIAGASRPLLLEEGVVHHVWRALYRSPDLRHEPWQPLVRGEHPLLVLQLDQAGLHERIRGKATQGSVNRELAEEAPGGPRWQRAAEMFDDVLSEAAKHREVMRVSTFGDVAPSVDRILRAMETLAATVS